MVDQLKDVGLSILAILTVVFAISYSFFGMRMVIRHLVRSFRERRLGSLTWYQVAMENRKSSTSANSIEGQTAAIGSFLQFVSRTRPPYWSRPVVSIVWNKDSNSKMSLYIGIDSANSETGAQAVSTLASNLNSRVVELDGPPEGLATGAPMVAYRSRYNANDVVPNPAQAGNVGMNLSEARNIDGTVILTLDQMRRSEYKRLKTYINEDNILTGGEGAMFSSVGNQVGMMLSSPARMSIAAFSRNSTPVESEQILETALSGMTSMGMSYTVNDPTAQHRKGVLLFTLLYAALLVPLYIFSPIPLIMTVFLTIPPIVISILSVLDLPFFSRAWFSARAAKGEIVVPSFVWFNMRFASHGLIRSFRHDAGGSRRVDNRNAPPSCKQVLTGYRSSVADFITTPERGSVALDVDIDSTPRAGLPSEMEGMNEDDIFLGLTGTNQIASKALSSLHQGIFIAGAPESGKTNMLQDIFVSVARASERNSLNYQITPIWLETKGKGSYDTWQGLNRGNKRKLFIDSHNPRSGYRLALEGRRLADGATPEQVVVNSNNLIAAMQYALGSSGIGPSSKEALQFSLHIAMLLTEDEYRWLDINDYIDPAHPHIIRMMWLILGGDHTIDLGKKLLSMVDSLDMTDSREKYLRAAIVTLNPYLNRERSVEERRRAPLNKLSEMSNAETFWSPDDHRNDVYVDQLTHVFAPIVINLGPYWDADSGDFSRNITSSLARDLDMMALHMIWGQVKSTSAGWIDTNKRICIFADELADIASSNEEGVSVFAEMAKEARGFGCSLYVAAQNLNQLPPRAAHEAMGFYNKAFFVLNHADDAAIAMSSLGRHSSFVQENIMSLPQGTAVVKLRINGMISPPFTLNVPRLSDWTAMIAEHGSLREAAFKHASLNSADRDGRYADEYDYRQLPPRQFI